MEGDIEKDEREVKRSFHQFDELMTNFYQMKGLDSRRAILSHLRNELSKIESTVLH
jgi:hypothetical protein